MVKIPNFILIGTQKSGSTALYHALKQHPEIFMSSIKEPKYFLLEEGTQAGKNELPVSIVSDWQSYTQLFSEVRDERAIGEASIMYLSAHYPERTARQIRHRLPDTKLIAVLRHPVDRAYSAYNFFRLRNFERLPAFCDALAAEDRRSREKTHPGFLYCRNGLYGEHLEKFLLHFPRTQLKVFLYEDWNERPQQVLEEIFTFLEVDPSVTVFPLKRTVTAFPRSLAFQNSVVSCSPLLTRSFPRLGPRLKHFLLRLNSVAPPPLDRKFRNQLIEYFEDDILKLQELIDRDLSSWLVRS